MSFFLDQGTFFPGHDFLFELVCVVDLDPVLLSLAFVCSLLNAIVGVGGGALLLLGMVYFIPPTALIPIHGITQITSGFSRAIFQWRAVQPSIVLWCGLGGLLGTGIASMVSVQLPEREFLIALASFILILTWVRPSGFTLPNPKLFFWVGSFVGFLSPLTGAVGPALAPFLMHRQLSRDQLVTTQAACVGCIDSLKVLWFVAFGFVLSQYSVLIFSLSAAVILGSFVGTRLRGYVPELWFRPMLRWIITLSALHVLISTLVA